MSRPSLIGPLRDAVGTALWLIALSLALLAVAYAVLRPSPPKHVVLATGVSQGAYAEFGRRYAVFLKAHGITVELRNTQGAAENLALLRDANSGVDLAFVQGGADERGPLETQREDEDLVSLGSVFYEPVWLFYREDSARRLLKSPVLSALPQLAGWRLNVGAPGSGVPPLMTRLLEANQVGIKALQWSQLPLTPAVVELLEGRMDALAMASAPESPMVQMLLQTPGIRLYDFAQAEAYARRFAFISAVTLPRGVVDIAKDTPPADVHLIAPTATLLAREGLHPALVQLFVQAAAQVHSDSGWFQHRGEFPNAAHSERPLSSEAQRFYRNGVPWLQRYLPFWLANLVDRMWVVMLSIVAVVIPLSRVLPPLVEMRIRSRVFRWYAQLREVEEARGQRPLPDLFKELDDIDERVGRVKVPLSYADELYALRGHIQQVRRRLDTTR